MIESRIEIQNWNLTTVSKGISRINQNLARFRKEGGWEGGFHIQGAQQ